MSELVSKIVYPEKLMQYIVLVLYESGGNRQMAEVSWTHKGSMTLLSLFFANSRLFDVG
jgi:hypothetical protein